MSDTVSPLGQSLALPCGLVLPNRLAKAAMTEGLADAYGRPTDKLCRLYEKWSDGGVGLLVTGNVQVDRRYVERPGNVSIDGPQSEEQIDMLKSYACAGKSHGSKIFVQLSHGGRQSNGMINLSPVGPGNVRLNLPKSIFGTPRALLVDEIVEVKERFVHAASVCKECGFDGIQIHSAHGYLLSSFLNPLANNRVELFGEQDPYGGPLVNRARLLLEIVREVRRAVGPSFAISVKLNSADFQEGGFAAEEAVEVIAMSFDISLPAKYCMLKYKASHHTITMLITLL
jgi:2,4-dienoyl-CoA reductase-like NADH-dependent reductase (Old Yellow Enzyme family)